MTSVVRVVLGLKVLVVVDCLILTCAVSHNTVSNDDVFGGATVWSEVGDEVVCKAVVAT